MLVSEVLNSQSIALARTEDASNNIPYLGLQFFPEEKKQGLDLSWIKTYKGLPVTLAPSNFDTLPTIRARQGLEKEKTQMAFFRESMPVSEEDQQEIDRIADENDPYLASAMRSIYDDTNTLLEGAEVVPERMRMQLLADAKIAIASGDVKYVYDYDPKGTYAANNRLAVKGTAQWKNATTATPLTDLDNSRKKLAKKGKIAKYALMTSTTFEYLKASKQVKDAILAQNITANIFVTDTLVKDVVKANTGLTVVIYDKMYADNDADKTEYTFYPDDKVTLLPDGKLGKTWFGTTPEERTGRQDKNVDVTIYRKGIAIAVKTVYGPPAEVSTTASEVVLPSYENMESTFIIDVNAGNE